MLGFFSMLIFHMSFIVYNCEWTKSMGSISLAPERMLHLEIKRFSKYNFKNVYHCLSNVVKRTFTVTTKDVTLFIGGCRPFSCLLYDE